MHSGWSHPCGRLLWWAARTCDAAGAAHCAAAARGATAAAAAAAVRRAARWHGACMEPMNTTNCLVRRLWAHQAAHGCLLREWSKYALGCVHAAGRLATVSLRFQKPRSASSQRSCRIVRAACSRLPWNMT